MRAQSSLHAVVVTRDRGNEADVAIPEEGPAAAEADICVLNGWSILRGILTGVDIDAEIERGRWKKEGDVAATSDGFSAFPGNINVLAFSLPKYVAVLDKSGGAIPEFVNPKYQDSSKTTFKKPTRLECMMQDYPKLLIGARTKDLCLVTCRSATGNICPVHETIFKMLMMIIQ